MRLNSRLWLLNCFRGSTDEPKITRRNASAPPQEITSVYLDANFEYFGGLDHEAYRNPYTEQVMNILRSDPVLKRISVQPLNVTSSAI